MKRPGFLLAEALLALGLTAALAAAAFPAIAKLAGAVTERERRLHALRHLRRRSVAAGELR